MSKQRSSFKLLGAIVLTTAASVFTCAQQTETAAATDKPPVADASKVALTTNDDNRYRIGPGDVLDIRILNRPNLSREAVRVEGSGMIRMPLIDNEIQAA